MEIDDMSTETIEKYLKTRIEEEKLTKFEDVKKGSIILMDNGHYGLVVSNWGFNKEIKKEYSLHTKAVVNLGRDYKNPNSDWCQISNDFFTRYVLTGKFKVIKDELKWI